MTLRLLRPAELELAEAIAWYDAISPDLAEKFIAEIRKTRNLILRYPGAWHPLGDGARRCRLEKFPYGLIYFAEGDEIIVVAVAHMHREPDYWRQRIEVQK